MKLPTRRPDAAELPGIVGRARVDRRSAKVPQRLQPGDIVVIQRADLDAGTARALLRAGVVGVVNTDSFITGSYPTLGAQVLVDADVLLVEATPMQAAGIRDGARVRIHEGVVFDGEDELLRGRRLDAEVVARERERARDGMGRQLDVITRNSAEFLRREQDLLLHGEGFPPLATPFRDRTVVVVARGVRHDEELVALRRFLSEERPLLVGVDAGAEVLLEHRLRPDLIVLTAALVGAEGEDAVTESTVKLAREVVVQAGRAGNAAAPASQRLQRWGLTTPIVTTDVHAFDLGLLLAAAGGAKLIVPVGRDVSLEEVLDRGRTDQSSELLTRLRLGGLLVDAAAVPQLYSGRVRGWHLLLIALVALIALWLAVATTPIGNVWWHDTNGWFVDRFNDLKGFFQ